MAVAALSTSAIALATAPAAAPTPAMGESSEAFAKLVSRAKPDDQAPQGDARPESAEGEIETVDVATEKAASSEGEAKAVPTAKVDLLAELEAIFAAAAQIGVTVPVPMAMPSASVAPTITVTTGTVARDAANSPKAATIVPSFTAPAPAGLPIAAQPVPTETFAAKAAALAVPIDPAAVSEPPAPPTAAPKIAADPGTDGAATTTLRRDIAVIVASLKAAFHPAEAGDDSSAATPIPPVGTPAASMVVLPFVQAPPATATGAGAVVVPLAAMPLVAMPVADAAAPVPAEGEAPVDDAIIASASPDTVTDKPATTVAPKAVPPFIIDHIAPVVPTKAAEIATPVAALADAPDPGSVDESAASAAPAITPAPLAAVPAVPAAVTPVSWTEAPGVDAATAAAPAPDHAEQSVVRHLDLARDTQWLDQLARDISQSVAQQGHLKFQLNPEHLGALTVEIANSAAGTAIKLSAETDQARAIIADAQPRLLAEVRAQGLRVSESHVDLSQQGSSGSAFAQGQQRHSSEDSKPFVRTQAVNRDDAGDSAPREDGELYA